MSSCIGSFLLGFCFSSRFLFSAFGFLFLFCIHNIFTCISHWGLLYVQHERINKMQAKLHENQSPNRVELSAILGVASCRGTCQGCQHLTDLIISILFPSLSLCVSLAISSRRTMLQGERVACCIPHASCPIVMRKYGICVTIKCASHLCYPHPHECVLDPPSPGQVPGSESAAALPAPPTCGGATWCCWCRHNLTCSILHAPKLC